MRQVKEEFEGYFYSEVVSPIQKANYRVGDPTIYADDLPEESEDGYLGKLEGKVEFYDGSWLEFMEVIEFSNNKISGCLDMDRPFYKYNYHDSDNLIRIAYHCSPKEKIYKSLNSFPHHKHVGPNKNDYTEGNKDVKIKDIIEEIENELEE